MANKKTRAVSKQELEQIIITIRTGFVLPTGEKFRANERIAVALTLQANLGLRIGDIVKLKLSDIVLENGRYHLQIIEQKTGKARNFTVPSEVYIFIQSYALNRGLKPTQRLFDLTVRAVQNHLQKVCGYLEIKGVSTHSFRKFFAQSMYEENNYDIALIQELLQHSSIAITQRYLGVSSQKVEQALQKHIVIPA
ncbi:tyrosine-type recombinase/integrase [Butyricicoccus faecihominis]|uniref:tyrosine-type recombinase/integrase n=1 Tax=Butyricicoccus faecihominis TaxID=1712515 RepID=UPI0024792F8B|nr:tyrosine-type recombinase/integrase [Butyricicoccus faecihominis]MCQ5128813.1 tyrosine-type recombinase/integrase [Butyricicoccus faecihominis]